MVDPLEKEVCDRCGESLINEYEEPDCAVLTPDFGYCSGLDLIQEGPNRMRLYFCEKCYEILLKLLGLEIGCNPQDGYHWVERQPEVTISTGITEPDSSSGTGNVPVAASYFIETWPRLKKKH